MRTYILTGRGNEVSSKVVCHVPSNRIKLNEKFYTLIIC